MRYEMTNLWLLRFITTLCMLTILSAAAIGENISIESAQKFFSQGEYEKCLGVVNSLLEKDPNNADAHAWMGSALGMLAQKTPDMMMKMQYGMKAMQEFETAIQLDPNNFMGRMGRGMSMLMAPPPFGNVDSALADLQKVVELEPNSAEGHFYLGLAYQKKGEVAKAKAEFEKALQLNPEYEQAKAELGKLAGEKTEPTPVSDSRKKHGKGWSEEQNGFLILHLKGSHYDMGYQQGMLIKDSMGNIIDEASSMLGLDDETLPKIQEATKRMDKFIPGEYREQMRGLADALGMSYDEILLWNTFIDAKFVKQSSNPIQQCTNFLAFSKATADSKVIHGANLEFGHIIMNRMITNNGKAVWLAVYEPDDGHSFAIVMPGPMMVSGYFAINDAGLTISQTFLPAKDSTLDGIPMFMLLRKVIQNAGNIPAALKIVQESPRTYGSSMMFAHGKTNKGAAIEYSATRCAVRKPSEDILLTTNRAADKELYETMEKGLLPDDSEKAMSLREKRYSQMLKASYGRIDIPKAVDFLRDHIDPSTGKNTILFPAIGSSSVISSIVFRPADFDFWVAHGDLPMVYGEFVGFNLKALLAGEKSQVKPERIKKDIYLDSEEFRVELKEAEEKARQLDSR